MSYNTLAWQIDDRVLTLTPNRPEQLNAFTVEMANELIDAYQRASEDDAVGAVVVTGAGRAFCAGMDLCTGGNVFGLDESLTPSLAELNAGWDDPAMVQGVRDTGGRVALAVYDCKKPLVPAGQLPAEAHALAHKYIDHRSPCRLRLRARCCCATTPCRTRVRRRRWNRWPCCTPAATMAARVWSRSMKNAHRPMPAGRRPICLISTLGGRPAPHQSRSDNPRSKTWNAKYVW